jgi:hypothetical protein
MQLVEELAVTEAKQEAKAQEAKSKLEKSNERDEETDIGDIRGEWDMYSSLYFDHIRKNALHDDYFDPEDWQTGKSLIGHEYRHREGKRGENELGAELEIHGDEGRDTWQFDFTKPKSAALEPLLVRASNLDDEAIGVHDLEFTLLGNGVLEIRMPNSSIPKDYRTGRPVNLVGLYRKANDDTSCLGSDSDEYDNAIYRF